MARRSRRFSQSSRLYSCYADLDWYQDHLDPQDNGCITWTGGHHPQGYGMMPAFRLADQSSMMILVHRLSMELKLRRALTRKEYVIHSCDNQGCCNTEHLMLGSGVTKMQMCQARGNYRPPTPGQRKIRRQNRQYKWTEDEILWMRTADLTDIALRFSVNRKKASDMRSACRNRYAWLK